uniref:DUF4216 domain-containing protein n=1 Tax=Chenopodium quinoa TaxID=63459 RepID=A0A803N0U6_CHEQI
MSQLDPSKKPGGDASAYYQIMKHKNQVFKREQIKHEGSVKPPVLPTLEVRPPKQLAPDEGQTPSKRRKTIAHKPSASQSEFHPFTGGKSPVVMAALKEAEESKSTKDKPPNGATDSPGGHISRWKDKNAQDLVIIPGDVESGGKDFYGTLDEVIVLEYDALENRIIPKVVLFRCKWFDVFSDARGIKKDKFGSTLVNVSCTLQTNEPFALAFKIIEQVFFISSHDERHWKYVIKVKSRNFFDFPNDEDAEQNEYLWNVVEEGATNLEEFTTLSDEEINMVRDDVELELVDAERHEIDEDLEDVEFDSDSSTDSPS